MSVVSNAVGSSDAPQVTRVPIKVKVSSPFLLSLYAIIPLCFLLVLFDYLFFGNQLRDTYLPKNPATLVIWAIIFNFPHITSSLITLIDDEYIPFYKKRFTRVLIAIALRSEEHTSELQSRPHLVCRLLLEKKKKLIHTYHATTMH